MPTEKKRRGRPPLNPDRTKPKEMRLRLDTLLVKRLTAACADRKVLPPMLIREILTAKLPPPPPITEEHFGLPPSVPEPLPEHEAFPQDSSDVEDPAVPYYDALTGLYR